MRKFTDKSWFLALLSVLLLSLPWIGGSFGVVGIFGGLVPLLVLEKRLAAAGSKKFWWWALAVFTGWILATCWWVSLSTVVALFAVPLVGLAFLFLPFMVWQRLFRGAPEHLRWIALVAIWITAEAAYTYGEISFPWLTLGNSLWDTPTLAQWYEFTGVFGGSLWILVINILLFKAVSSPSWKKYAVTTGVVIFAPIITSLGIYYTYVETKNPISFTVIQPNIDPYNEKFGGMSVNEQRNLLLTLASEAPVGSNYIVFPETSWPYTVDLNQLGLIDSIRGFLRVHSPATTLITGATTLRVLKSDEPSAPFTHDYENSRINVYNSALWIDTSATVNIYHKSKLVCGVELLPYPAIFGAIDQLFKVDLGGYSGHLGSQERRETFGGVGTAICYEGIYGEFFTEYVHAGAEVMVVISNDGWWGETDGHRQLLGYSRLRAIETRRSIARSANTGISALIDQRGDVTQRLDWDVRGVLTGELNRSREVTLYVQAGDYVARIAFYIMCLSVLYLVAWRVRQRH